MLSFPVFLSFFILTHSVCGASFGRTQHVAVSGELKCEGKPAEGIRVELMESDNNGDNSGLVDMDDFMSATSTDVFGFFNLTGSETEVTGIEPYVNIFHKCADGQSPCQRVLRINIPKSATTWGSTPSESFSLGVFELSGRVLGELRSCAHRDLSAPSSTYN